MNGRGCSDFWEQIKTGENCYPLICPKTSILGPAWGTKLDTILYVTEILHLFRQWEQKIPVYKNVSIFSREEKRPFTNTFFRNSSPERLIYFRKGSWKMMNTTFINFERKKNVMLYLNTSPGKDLELLILMARFSILGSCTDMLNAFACTCQSGFTGPRCEVNINDCPSSGCGNGEFVFNK